MTFATERLEASTAAQPLAHRGLLDEDDALDGADQETFCGTVCAAGLLIHLAGISARFADETVTGSAGSCTEDPLSRAASELSERLAILRAIRRAGRFVVYDQWREALGVVSNERAFPCAPAGAPFRHARSNGVAAGVAWRDAARRARFELVERDRVLRSWFGHIVPKRVSTAPGKLPPIDEHYDVRAYVFGEPALGVTVAGVFAFPRGRRPLVYGFGARDELDAALGVASSELVQRLGFLWDEPLPESQPEPRPTPAFHQDHYLFPPNHERIHEWLSGAHGRFAGVLAELEEPREPVYVDVGTSYGPVVVRALPRGHLPLVFGMGHPSLQGPVPPELAVHPIV